MKGLVVMTLVAAVLGFSSFGNAALVDRGGGLIYDSDLDITWLQQPNNSYVSRDEAAAWATALTVGGMTGWRLPSALNQDGSGPCQGYNCTGSEMGHLFYVELGNSAGRLSNRGFFSGLRTSLPYWFGTERTNTPGTPYAFYFGNGNQGWDYRDDRNFALAVHDGDIGAPVPIPGAVWLLGTGLLGLIRFRKIADRKSSNRGL